jgi:hypothetical protein
MSETTSEYHRRRAVEEMTEAAAHRDDITAEHHRRLARQHLALARETEKIERNGLHEGK